MTVKPHIWAMLIVLFSCAPRREAESLPPAQSRWQCFNGREIVLRDGLYGLETETGETVLPTIYNSIEFLDNDIALLSQGEKSFLCTRAGRILAAGNNTDSLRLVYPEIEARALEDDRISWEKVLDRYRLLCRACKSKRGQRLSRKEYRELQVLNSSVREALDEATGVPTITQKSRLEAISEDYRRAF
ncbi:MAG: WG repeat-containing protein [Bacteroidales bacterium]|nr:WG repeat-containing protein [Bacteroidales bacterium]